MFFLLMTFVPVQKLCVDKYVYICSSIWVFFLRFTNCVLLSDDNSLIPGCLWLLPFVLNNTLILGIWCSTIPHLPGCFCPWTFFQNIRFNMVPSDLKPMSHYNGLRERMSNGYHIWQSFDHPVPILPCPFYLLHGPWCPLIAVYPLGSFVLVQNRQWKTIR